MPNKLLGSFNGNDYIYSIYPRIDVHGGITYPGENTWTSFKTLGFKKSINRTFNSFLSSGSVTLPP